MDNNMRSNLCKSLRASGIPKPQCLQIVNTIEKWDNANGPEWVVKRIKAFRQWYETFLAGDPVAPEWFKHDRNQLPTGIWKWVFGLPIAKALAVFSVSTLYYEKSPSQTQLEKFQHGLEGTGTQDAELSQQLKALARSGTAAWHSQKPGTKLGAPPVPTLFDMNGSVPVHEGHSVLRPDTLGEALTALEQSWDSVPQVTFDFLDRFRPDGEDLLGYIPPHILGNDYVLELNKPHCSVVGRIGLVQEPELKGRFVANPNRVLQCTLNPFKELLMGLVRDLPWDFTHDQELGMLWVQEQLRSGTRLAGSDMTSASDLLDLEMCLDLIEYTYGLNDVENWKDYRDYFLEVSRSEWFCPQLNRNVSWRQGDPLGTGPSFGILTLTNGALGVLSCLFASKDGKIPPFREVLAGGRYFACIGDDFICDERIAPYYTRLVRRFGGDINLSKTLTSDRVAEFAGRIITPNQIYLKRVCFAEPSDNSFMSVVSQLGDQAKYLLRPRQRKAYQYFKEVPGIAVKGPWLQDSYGVPLSDRYQWYLEEVQPALERLEPDLITTSYDLVLLQAMLALDEKAKPYDIEKSVPWAEGYLPSEVTPRMKVHGDPRLTNGKTLLEVLTDLIQKGSVLPFNEWNQSRIEGLAAQGRVLTRYQEAVLQRAEKNATRHRSRQAGEPSLD